jgi:protein TonB
MSPVTDLHEPEVLQEVQKKGVPRPEAVEATFVEPLSPGFFSDVLLEADSATKHRRRWATTSSVIVQSLILGVLLIVPLMFTEALPKQQLLTFLIAPPPPPPPPPPAAAAPVKIVRQIQTDLLDGHLRAPSRIPQRVQMIKEEEAPPPMVSGTGVVGGVPGGIPGGQLGGVIGGIISSANNASVPKLAAPEPPKRIRISQGVTRGMRIFSPQPAYPKIAQAARVSGDVVLTAIISRQGEIEHLTVLSGHPLLVSAAIQAVEQWRYRPFLLNDQPIEVETTITVSFKFNY